ncbi:hypothetical protein [Prevotellamassilia timonensis]|uniref:hypothetical protein n=1 Tax=Prevotellamassilia timonensis TaxID=1852370 RepID=UPI003077161F
MNWRIFICVYSSSGFNLKGLNPKVEMFTTPHALAVKRHGAFWFCKVKVKEGVCPNFYDVFSGSPYFWYDEPLRVLRSWAANAGYRKAGGISKQVDQVDGFTGKSAKVYKPLTQISDLARAG